MTLREIKKSVRALNSRQLAELDTWLHELIDSADSKKPDRAAAARRVLEERKNHYATCPQEGPDEPVSTLLTFLYSVFNWS